MSTARGAVRFRWSALLGGLAVLAVLGATVQLGVGRLRPQPAPGRKVLARFTEQEVAVEVASERDSTGALQLAARFTPTRPGFRLCALELPEKGIKGVGRPTRLAIARAPALHPLGPLTADRPAGRMRGRVPGLTFPVYPPGPVTLRLPVEAQSEHGVTAELAVTYMACSERRCLPAVEDRRVTVRIPPAP